MATSEDIMYNFFVSNQALRFGPTFMQFSTVAAQIQLNLIGVYIIPLFCFHFNQWNVRMVYFRNIFKKLMSRSSNALYNFVVYKFVVIITHKKS